MPQPIRLAETPARAGSSPAWAALWRWADGCVSDAAEGFSALAERLRPRAKVVFSEQPDGALADPSGEARLQDGAVAWVGAAPRLRHADVEFSLSAARCMFRDIDLPAGAGAFLDGVVRAQLDRLTPWRASEAAFGWSVAAPTAAGVIRVTIAATKRQPLAALLEVPAHSVAVTILREAGAAPIAILSRRAGASSRHARARLMLIAALGLALVAAASAAIAEWTLGADLQDRADALTAELAHRRAALLRRERSQDDEASRALDARKRATPATVVALEALSRALPDDAYVTQMRVAGDKIEVTGISADAAGLIKLIERSPHFSQATFTAPTTRGADDRETFRIQAHLAPLNTEGP